MRWSNNNRTLNVREKAAVVGILNVTPDSYFDGGAYRNDREILNRVRQMIDEGADMIDIGGESTGPGSPDVQLEEELKRVISALEIIRKKFPDLWISIDTYTSEVARQALAAGADMINDITAGRGDPQMFSVVAAADCPVILMHAKDATARTSVQSIHYDDVIAHVHAFLRERIEVAKDSGVRIENIVIDPGLGHFVSSDPVYSWRILGHLKKFTDLAPVLVSPSRKSFLAGPKKLPPAERLPATLAATGIALINGAKFIRTHDVKATVAVRDAMVPG